MTGASPAAKPSPVEIWLIEDSPTDVYVIKEVLKESRLEFALRVATDGESALSLIAAVEQGSAGAAPDVILLDLNLPKVSGTEILKEIRKASRFAGIPVIIVTSSDSPADVYATQKLGATAYFRKPSDLDEFMRLKDVIQTVLDNRQQ